MEKLPSSPVRFLLTPLLYNTADGGKRRRRL